MNRYVGAAASGFVPDQLPSPRAPDPVYRWLAAMVERHASALHLLAGAPPTLRVADRMEALAEPPLTGERLGELLVPLLTSQQRDRFEESRQLDFCHTVPGLARFRLSLFRAVDGLGPLSTWDREYREPLGSREEVKAALERFLMGLHWRESSRLLSASGPFDGEEHAYEISLYGEPNESLRDISVYSSPPAIRTIMSGLRLNYCYALDSGEFYFPFKAGDHWPGAAR